MRPKPPRFECMWDGCSVDTGSETYVYCAKHRAEVHKPENCAPRTRERGSAAPHADEGTESPWHANAVRCMENH